MADTRRTKSPAKKPEPKSKSKTTVMKQNEGELVSFVEDLKRQWMATIDALVDPLMIVSKDYRITKANLAMARTAGADVKEIVGKRCHEVFAGRQTPCKGCTMQQAAGSGTSTTFTLEHIGEGDSYFEVTSQPLFDGSGNSEGVVQVYRDRTAAKKMQEQLAQQDKLASIGLLAGGVAHEINNPLGGILIFSQMLLREMAKDSPHYPDVVEIEAATQRCKAIVESLLDFARQNPSGSGGKVAQVNALEAIRTALRFGKVSIKKSGEIDIAEEFDAEAHFLAADRNKIIQIFLNLIQNAIQAMPDGGSLVVRARTRIDGDRITGIYEVEDSGVGIAPENLKKIFDPFFTTKDPGEGTGLGLALCYGTVQDMKGRLSVESKVNVGTRFTIELPLSRAVMAERTAS